jgi:hypothetical protein
VEGVRRIPCDIVRKSLMLSRTGVLAGCGPWTYGGAEIEQGMRMWYGNDALLL